MIKCRICLLDKEESEFYENCKTCRNKCKECYKASYQKSKSTTLKNWELKNREKLLSYKKEYYNINKEELLLKQKESYKNLDGTIKKKRTKRTSFLAKKRMEDAEYRKEVNRKRREYRQANITVIKTKRNKRLKHRYKNDEVYKLSILLRTAFYKAIKRKSGTKQKSIMDIIGCSQEFLKNYIEKQFKPEMNWKNHGKIWEIDHIKPIDFFNLKDLEEQKNCFSYLNLQPLFKTTAIAESFGYLNEIGNHNKSNKYE